MFDALQENLGSAFKTLRGQRKLTEANMREPFRRASKLGRLVLATKAV
ncbi:MAG: hypothetical protein AAF266_00855 [Planctomycetota bacterium]